MSSDNLNKEYKHKKVLIFFIFTLISFSFHHFQELGLLKYTFKPFEVFMHEIGHGFTSLIFGGTVVDLHLEYNQGSVSHMTSAFAQPFVSFSGYLSASLFGFLLYISSIHISKYIKILLVLISLFWFIYVDGITTFIILSLITLTFVASWYLKTFGSYFLRFLGVYIMVSSIYSPTYLWAYSDTGDHVSLSQQTLIPSFVWISIWSIMGVFFLYKSFKLTK
jgi:hypothetical protein